MSETKRTPKVQQSQSTQQGDPVPVDYAGIIGNYVIQVEALRTLLQEKIQEVESLKAEIARLKEPVQGKK